MPTIGAICVAALTVLVLILCAAATGVFQTDAKWVQASISFAAIVVALGLAVEQRYNAARLRLEDQAQRHASHRAKMHFALSRIFSYAAISISVLRNIVEANLEELLLTHSILAFPRVEPREPNGEAVRDIAECISSCSNASNARSLSRLIQWTQIHLTRTEALISREDKSVSEVQIASLLLDSARLQGMVSRVFPYARFQTEVIDVDLTGAQIEDVLIQNHIVRDDPAFEPVFQIMPSRTALWRDPPF